MNNSNRSESAPNGWRKLLLYARTLRHLEPVQIYSRLRLRPRLKGSVGPLPLRTTNGTWAACIVKERAQTGPNRFRFLNQEREIASWNDSSVSYLWLYNLHYFEYVDEALAMRWIDENPLGQGIGWDPYPTSLRIANWSKFILSTRESNPRMLASLATQAAWIERRLERHLLANHLLANAKALIFAGSLFEGSLADRWRATGLSILEQELPRQILSDGAHLERSPMYHSIILEDMLDLCNLGQTFAGLLPDFSGYASRMLGWLDQMTYPDGEISLFNDAAFGIAPAPAAIHAYARTLGVPVAPVRLGESGYIRLENDRAVVIFDAAPLGPDYQPGHGHADTLSFELYSGSGRLLVNSGTSTYDEGPVRSFERGTASHNTVRIDGVDQSEMWASFRVARRAHPLQMRTDDCSWAEAAHDGYRRLTQPLVHRRRLDLHGDTVVVTDWLEGRGRHTVELFFHAAPEAVPAIELDPALERTEILSLFSAGFNLRVPNRTIAGRWTGECPARFETRIHLPQPRTAEFSTQAATAALLPH